MHAQFVPIHKWTQKRLNKRDSNEPVLKSSAHKLERKTAFHIWYVLIVPIVMSYILEVSAKLPNLGVTNIVT